MLKLKNIYLVLALVLSLLALGFFVYFNFTKFGDFTILILVFSLGLSVQNIFTLVWMLYGWSSPIQKELLTPPKDFDKPKLSFTALLPARHEEQVIKDTLLALSNIKYPENLKEVLVLCREDDTKTIEKARETINKIGKKNIKLVIFDGNPINKPHALNIGLKLAKGEVVTIFDSEDEPHPDIYSVVNSTFAKYGSDVVQSGVQLMNYQSKWFSALNVLEYYFWFKSGLHFFSKVGKVAPLGGNTVFIKKEKLIEVNGWDEKCLTEDADIGIRLSAKGSKIKVIYDEKYVTKEETPTDLGSFIKQRTRWDQGFIQIFLKGDWTTLPYLRQKLIILYVLLAPIVQAIVMMYIPLGVFIAMTTKLSLLVSLISFLPFYLTAAQMITYMVGIFKFTREYKLHFSVSTLLSIVISFYPYQLVLAVSALRALSRIIFNNNAWEKTLHLNGHRKELYA